MAVFFYCQEDADADGGEIPPCSSVKLDKTLLSEQRVRLIHSVHVHAYHAGEPPHRRKGLSFLKDLCCDPYNNLMLQLSDRRRAV